MIGLPHEAYLAAMAGLEGLGPVRMRWLLNQGTPEQIWQRLISGGLQPGPDSGGVTTDLLSKWRRGASQVNPGEVWRRCEKLGIGVVSLGSAGYPAVLARDLEPPIVLFQKGDPAALDAPRVAIIGTRRATGYGLRIAETLGRQLAEAGVVVVSGLALGIDAAAHRGALAAGTHRDGTHIGRAQGDRAQGDRTHSDGVATPLVGVVANGLDAPCPAANRRLAASVAANGIIYSEVPPGTPSAPWRFPVRNRIIAALADAVVVVESAGSGGSMHTVREALERDTTVLAVPGPIGARASEGSNQLIRDGALPCLGVEDILMAIEPSLPSVEKTASRRSKRAGFDGAALSADRDPVDRDPASRDPVAYREPDRRAPPVGDDARVLELIEWRPVSLETLLSRSGLKPRQLAASLSTLEGDGWILRSGSWIERRSG